MKYHCFLNQTSVLLRALWLISQLFDNNYRPQTKFAKVMFLQVSVCPHGGGAWLLWGGACVVTPGGYVWLLREACVVAPGGVVCVVAPRGVCVVNPGGGMHGYSGGACMVAPGGMCGI